MPGSAEPGVIGVIGVAGPIIWWTLTLGKFSERSVIGTMGDIRLCCIYAMHNVLINFAAIQYFRM